MIPHQHPSPIPFPLSLLGSSIETAGISVLNLGVWASLILVAGKEGGLEDEKEYEEKSHDGDEVIKDVCLRSACCRDVHATARGSVPVRSDSCRSWSNGLVLPRCRSDSSGKRHCLG